MGKEAPFLMKISVCIPAYKNADYLKRCLFSLTTQSFKDFEVIISDDSPDNSVQLIVEEYNTLLNIRYYKNTPALGTPANWNFAMIQASGEYIKLMHDDDWFASENALQDYYDCLEANPSVEFCFSAFYNVQIESGNIEPVFCSWIDRYLLKKSRYNLFKKNFIGPPSVVFQRNNKEEWYDERLKWLVDFEGYIRFLNMDSQFIYMGKCLVNIGLGNEQVTQSTKHVTNVVLPESLYFLQKHGEVILKNIWVYDYYWRMFRNLSIRNTAAITETGWEEELPARIVKMLSFQQKIPMSVLQFGPLSKCLMLMSFMVNR